MSHRSLLAVFTLISVCSATDFSFENITADWFLKDTEHVIHGKKTNILKDLYPQEGIADSFTTVHINGSIDVLHENAVANMTDLVIVTLSDVNLQKIEPGAFKNLPQLDWLYLEKNKLKELKSGTFVNLPFTHLDLSNNEIDILEVGAFKNLPNLHTLKLENNKIGKIKRGVFNNIKVRLLLLSNNCIRELEDGILESVLMTHKYNIYVELINNTLEEINPRALNHPFITHVYLANNSISVLRPGDLQNLPQLEYLQLRGNKLREIPEGVFNNLNVVSVDLSHNQIIFVANGAFNNMPKLRILRLDHNKIKTWNSNWFYKSEAITTIFFSDNDVEELPEEAFKNLRGNFSIDLAANRIQSISPRAFQNSASRPTIIQYLILRDNQIGSWSRSLLEGRINVTGIDLRRNKLNCFDGSVDDVFRNSEVVWLSDNKFDASCVDTILKYAEKHKLHQAPEKVEEEMIY